MCAVRGKERRKKKRENQQGTIDVADIFLPAADKNNFKLREAERKGSGKKEAGGRFPRETKGRIRQAGRPGKKFHPPFFSGI